MKETIILMFALMMSGCSVFKIQPYVKLVYVQYHEPKGGMIEYKWNTTKKVVEDAIESKIAGVCGESSSEIISDRQDSKDYGIDPYGNFRTTYFRRLTFHCLTEKTQKEVIHRGNDL